MDIARLIAFVAGILIVVLVMWSVFTSLVVPRASSSRLQMLVGRLLGNAARGLAPKLPTYDSRDRLLSFIVSSQW